MPGQNAPVYDVRYAEQGTALLLEADLSRGWCKRKDKYAFFGTKWIDYKRGLRIRTQLSLWRSANISKDGSSTFVCPASSNYSEDVFPNVSIRGRDGCASYALVSGLLLIKIDLEADQPWKIMSTGRPGLYINDPMFLYVPKLCSYHLQVHVIFHELQVTAPPDLREWCQKHFVSGGQFESNRRRH